MAGAWWRDGGPWAGQGQNSQATKPAARRFGVGDGSRAAGNAGARAAIRLVIGGGVVGAPGVVAALSRGAGARVGGPWNAPPRGVCRAGRGAVRRRASAGALVGGPFDGRRCRAGAGRRCRPWSGRWRAVGRSLERAAAGRCRRRAGRGAAARKNRARRAVWASKRPPRRAE